MNKNTNNTVEEVINEATVKVEKKVNPKRMIFRKTNVSTLKLRHSIQKIFMKVEDPNFSEENKKSINERLNVEIFTFEQKLESILNEASLISQVSSLSEEQREALKKML